MSRRTPAPNRSWWRDYFKDHPKLAEKAPEAFSGTGATHDKAKVFCKPCLEQHIRRRLTEDIREVSEGRRRVVRPREAIEDMLFAVAQHDPAREWLTARTDVLLNHLRTCELHAMDVRQRAKAQRLTNQNLKSPRRATTDSNMGASNPFSALHPVSPYARPPTPVLRILPPDLALMQPYPLAALTSTSLDWFQSHAPLRRDVRIPRAYTSAFTQQTATN